MALLILLDYSTLYFFPASFLLIDDNYCVVPFCCPSFFAFSFHHDDSSSDMHFSKLPLIVLKQTNLDHYLF